MERAIAEINELEPDIVVCSGDLTTYGFKEEYVQARRHLDEAPAQFHQLCGRGSLLRAEHRGSLAKACRHVAGDDELHSLERGG